MLDEFGHVRVADLGLSVNKKVISKDFFGTISYIGIVYINTFNDALKKFSDYDGFLNKLAEPTY